MNNFKDLYQSGVLIEACVKAEKTLKDQGREVPAHLRYQNYTHNFEEVGTTLEQIRQYFKPFFEKDPVLKRKFENQVEENYKTLMSGQ